MQQFRLLLSCHIQIEKTPADGSAGVFHIPASLRTYVRETGSPGRTRTSDMVVNSHPLYQLSYRGIAPIG